MDNSKELKRIYRIEVLGVDAATKKVEQLNQEIALQTQIKKEAQKILLANPGDAVQIEKQSKVIAESEIALKKLNAEKRIAIKEADALITAQERIAKAELQAKQNGELAAGSYKALFAESKRLSELYRSTSPNDPLFEKIKADAIEAKRAVDDFNRTLASDGTLVGEYSKGIINAFKSADMGEILKQQVQKGEAALAQLDDQLEVLKKEYQELKAAGTEGLDAIEKKLIENRQQAIELGTQVSEMRQHMASAGQVGNQVTEGLKNGFKQLSSELVNTAIAFVGIQAGINAVQNFTSGAIAEFEQAELATARFEARLRNMGRGGELDALKSTIDELAERFKSIDNDDLTEAAEKLVTYGKVTKTQIQSLLPLIIDFARNQRIGIGEATTVIIKGLEGQGKALKEYGINLKDTKNTTEAYNLLTTELAKKVQGSADVFESTATGELAIHKQELKNQQEILGEKLLPLYIKLTQILVTVASVLVSLPFPAVAAGLLLMIGLTDTWIGSKIRLAAAFILEKSALVIETIQLGIANGVRATANFLTAAYTAALLTSATASGVAAVAARVLAAAIALVSSPIGIVIGLTAALVTVVGALSANASTASKNVKGLAQSQAELAAQQRVNAQITERVTAATSDLVSKIKQYTFIATDATASDKVRREALNKLIEISPKYRQALNGEAIDIAKVTKASDELIASLQKQARVKAVRELVDTKEKRKFELENAIEASYKPIYASDGKTIVGKEVNNADNNILDAFTGNTNVDALNKKEKELAEINTELKQIYKMVGENKELQQDIVDNAGKKIVDEANKPFDAPKTDKTKKTKTAQEIRDERLKQIKDEEDAQKRIAEIRFKKGEIDEIQYLTKIDQLTQEYADKKLAVVLKAADKEKNRISEFQLDKINSEKDTNEKIYKIKQEALDKNFKLEEFKDDPKQSKTENAEAKLAVDKRNKEATLRYQNESLILQNQYHIKNIENEKKWADEIKRINDQLAVDLIEIDKARLEDIKTAGDTQLAEFKAQMAAKRRELLEQGKSTKQLDKEENFGTLARELASLNSQFEQVKKLYETGQISAKEYYDFLAERDRKAAELIEANTERMGKSFKQRLQSYKGFADLLQGELSNLLTPKDENGQDKEGYAFIGEALSQSFDIAKQAMNDYFDQKKARIEEEKEYELNKLDIEKNQRLSRAQSQAEEDSINRQYAKKKQEIERKAFEEQKKLKKSEAKIALATELANIAVQAAANPANAATFGAAGLIQFAVLGALAAARYALRVGEINSQKFSAGGWLGSGGEINGPSHAQGGVPFNTAEAEGGELAIINKRAASSSDVYTVTGTTKQIASQINEAGGGRRFAIGGKLSKLEYGGSFGKQLGNPGDVSYLHDNGTRELIEATNKRIDNIKVFVVSKEVEKENNKLNKAAEINTL